MRDWELYINRQKGQQCQLITALNIWTYFTGKTMDIESKAYEKLVDLVGARYGTAISVNRAHKKLGIEPHEYSYSTYLVAGPYSTPKTKIVKMPIPFELLVWHKRTGYHSVAVVEYDEKTDAYRVPNFREVTTSQGWIFAEDLEGHIKPLSSKEPWVARTFRRVRKRRR